MFFEPDVFFPIKLIHDHFFLSSNIISPLSINVSQVSAAADTQKQYLLDDKRPINTCANTCLLFCTHYL